MLSNEEYVTTSLELNLFFLRIMKEHDIFIAASLPAKDAPVAMQFVSMSKVFERLLSSALSLANGNISTEVMTSGELVTPLTLPAERAIEFLTGLPIDTLITTKEISLGYREYYVQRGEPIETLSIVDNVSTLNKKIIEVLNAAINFQSNLLNQILSCRIFSYVYPSNLEHVTEEARLYLRMLNNIENRQDKDTTVKKLIEKELFWNHIMEEHSKFIRGYLDPSEKELFDTANNFAEEFSELYEETKELIENPNNFKEVTEESYKLVTKLRNFKRQGTEGLLSCKIKAIMPALLADHVTREANHYLRLLRAVKS